MLFIVQYIPFFAAGNKFYGFLQKIEETRRVHQQNKLFNMN